MSPLASAMLAVFTIAWCLAVITWVYAAWFMVRFQIAWRRDGPWRQELRKSALGGAVFIGLVVVGFAAGLIAEVWGGGW